MGTYHFNCCICGKKVSARTKYFKRNLQKYFCVNAKELSDRYVCWACRKSRGEKQQTRTQLRVQIYPRFTALRKQISHEATKLKKLGVNNQHAMKNFVETTKALLDSEGIVRYSFIVENELKGISMWVPFLGIVEMKLNLNEDEYD